MQLPDESQAQSTERPEKVRAVDWIRLLCIQTWCLWWFVDETNVACLFDLRVCYVYVLCFVRNVTETSVSKRKHKMRNFKNESSMLKYHGRLKYATVNCYNKKAMDSIMSPW